jgi:diadenosine tetraphosphate (Ap4A) HIT family hydrolase
MLSSVAVACVFCHRLSVGDLLVENALAAAFPDAFPLSPGHCLVIPRRHEPDFFALTPEEQGAVWSLLEAVRSRIERERRPDGYNVGVNIGAAAGQTVAHAHLHLVPRYRGDVTDPRGGVRWIIPAKAVYWDDAR